MLSVSIKIYWKLCFLNVSHSRPQSTPGPKAAADDGSSCSDVISRQTALSPGLFACPLRQTVVFSSSTALNSHCCFSFHQAASSKPNSLPSPHRLSCCVSSLPQRWAMGVSLKQIRDISMCLSGAEWDVSPLQLPPCVSLHPFLPEIRFFDLAR